MSEFRWTVGHPASVWELRGGVGNTPFLTLLLELGTELLGIRQTYTLITKETKYELCNM